MAVAYPITLSHLRCRRHADFRGAGSVGATPIV